MDKIDDRIPSGHLIAPILTPTRRIVKILKLNIQSFDGYAEELEQKTRNEEPSSLDIEDEEPKGNADKWERIMAFSDVYTELLNPAFMPANASQKSNPKR